MAYSGVSFTLFLPLSPYGTLIMVTVVVGLIVVLVAVVAHPEEAKIRLRGKVRIHSRRSLSKEVQSSS